MTALALVLRRSNSLGMSVLLTELRGEADIDQGKTYSRRVNIFRIGRLSRLAAVIGLAISASSLAAQNLPEDECARLKDPEAEIVCLRAALAATRQARQAEVDPKPVETVPAQSFAPSGGTPSPTASPPERPALASDPELGREQVARPDGAPRPASEPEVLTDRISDFRADRSGALIMQLENGQIWRQVENVGLPLRLDEGEQVPVEITRSGFGGYRMHFPAMNRTISVSRIR